MTNQDLLKGNKISEYAELNQVTTGVDVKESDLNKYRTLMGKHPNTWWFAINSFRTLEGKETKLNTIKDIENY